MPKFPHVEVELSDQDGNAFGIIGRTVQAMKRAHVSADDIADYQDKAMSGDYNNVIQTTMEYVEVL